MNDYGSVRRHVWALPFEAMMLVGAAINAFSDNWKFVLISSFTFLVSFAPLMLERLLKVRLPASFQFTYVVFVFFSMFSGEVLRFYANVWGWDAAIHFLSGILIGLGIILWLRRLLLKKNTIRLPNWMQFLFVLTVSIGIAVVWEFVEFASDQLFGTNSQDSLVDTMYDLILGTAGTLTLLLAYVRHSKGRFVPMLGRAIGKFDPLNPLR